MDKEDRARQFIPFDALKGLQEALREKEVELVEKRELSEDISEELSKKIVMLESGDLVKITYYHNKQYHTIEGKVEYKDLIQRKLIIGNTKVNFDDISSVEII